jgi:hypothetical protein
VKKADWALIVLIVAVVGVIAYFVVGQLVPSPNKTLEQVPTATAISPTIDEVDTMIFNAEAINPTVKVTIGNQSDRPPFTLGQD